MRVTEGRILEHIWCVVAFIEGQGIQCGSTSQLYFSTTQARLRDRVHIQVRTNMNFKQLQGIDTQDAEMRQCQVADYEESFREY